MRKILIVDDDPEILELVKCFLEGRQMTVVTLPEGRKAVETVLQFEPDLIILDIDMPDVNGIDLLKFFKDRPMTSFIPVIMLTGKSAPSSQVSGLVSGADDYVTKPFDLNVLYARVISVLRRSLQQTRLKYDQLNLLRYLIKRYTKRDFSIYTKLLKEFEDHPNYWRGFVPDLIIEKGNKYRCFNFETTQSIIEETFLDRLRTMADIINTWHKSIEISIIVRTKENMRIVSRIIEENKLPITVKFIKKTATKS
ncbi:MAG: response regulator [Candidatus Marinimicrobia bacterium]|nr:response regulator [Candidatus Neomarinimicrobiota bacterium]